MRRSISPFLLCMPVLFGLMIPKLTLASPAQVVIIRHAEDPANEDETGLSSRGFQRAKALIRFFTSNTQVIENGTPVAIYAQTPKNENSSVRSLQTVIPLARHLGLSINQDFTKKKFKALVREIMENPGHEGGMVLVCWGHEVIRDMALEFGLDDPPKWKGDSFDRAWILDFNRRGEVTAFRNIPQRLLPGDSIR